MYNLSIFRQCLTLLLSLYLLAPAQVIASPLDTYVLMSMFCKRNQYGTDAANRLALPIATEAPTKQLDKRGVLEDLYKTVTSVNKVNTGTAKS